MIVLIAVQEGETSSERPSGDRGLAVTHDGWEMMMAVQKMLMTGTEQRKLDVLALDLVFRSVLRKLQVSSSTLAMSSGHQPCFAQQPLLHTAERQYPYLP